MFEGRPERAAMVQCPSTFHLRRTNATVDLGLFTFLAIARLDSLLRFPYRSPIALYLVPSPCHLVLHRPARRDFMPVLDVLIAIIPRRLAGGRRWGKDCTCCGIVDKPTSSAACPRQAMTASGLIAHYTTPECSLQEERLGLHAIPDKHGCRLPQNKHSRGAIMPAGDDGLLLTLRCSSARLRHLSSQQEFSHDMPLGAPCGCRQGRALRPAQLEERDVASTDQLCMFHPVRSARRSPRQYIANYTRLAVHQQQGRWRMIIESLAGFTLLHSPIPHSLSTQARTSGPDDPSPLTDVNLTRRWAAGRASSVAFAITDRPFRCVSRDTGCRPRSKEPSVVLDDVKAVCRQGPVRAFSCSLNSVMHRPRWIPNMLYPRSPGRKCNGLIVKVHNAIVHEVGSPPEDSEDATKAEFGSLVASTSLNECFIRFWYSDNTIVTTPYEHQLPRMAMSNSTTSVAALCGWVNELNGSIRVSTFQGSVQTCLLRPYSVKGGYNSHKLPLDSPLIRRGCVTEWRVLKHVPTSTVSGRSSLRTAAAVVASAAVRTKQHRNSRTGKTGDPRENPPTKGIVRHDSYLQNHAVTRPEIEPGFSLVGGEQANRSATPPRIRYVTAVFAYFNTERGGAVVIFRACIRDELGSNPGTAILTSVSCGYPRSLQANAEVVTDCRPRQAPASLSNLLYDLAVDETCHGGVPAIDGFVEPGEGGRGFTVWSRTRDETPGRRIFGQASSFVTARRSSAREGVLRRRNYPDNVGRDVAVGCKPSHKRTEKTSDELTNLPWRSRLVRHRSGVREALGPNTGQGMGVKHVYQDCRAWSSCDVDCVGLLWQVWIFGDLWCAVWLALDVWMCTASILNLCAISLDRYLAVTRPVTYPSLMSSARAKALIGGVWVLSFVICFPPLVGWRDRKDDDDENGVSGNSSLQATPQPTDLPPPCPWICELTNDAGYVVYSALGSFYIPMLVMLFFYWRIYRAAVSTTRAINQRLDCSPPSEVHRVQSPAGSLPDFRKWVSGRTIPLVGAFFSAISDFPRPCTPALLHSHLISPSSALETSAFVNVLFNSPGKVVVGGEAAASQQNG
ncbi:hypothetical protein PR048_019678 [Dryococelus australis]|uniref:G-protein coupled receptors family 1 profile domain-containing protein n=1 Tax=Dryococelus australis TaxID=614101 RepID=A0ABQ9H486_9NEOP|nr:hypothetical protein PR048_019678 [Dryococelus australis]